MGGHTSMIKLHPDEPEHEILEPLVHKPPVPPQEYTLAEVAQHKTRGDCWVVVNGMVLDLSRFAHPGGAEPIMMFAGKDASHEFNLMHGDQMIYKGAPNAIIGSLKASSRL